MRRRGIWQRHWRRRPSRALHQARLRPRCYHLIFQYRHAERSVTLRPRDSRLGRVRRSCRPFPPRLRPARSACDRASRWRGRRRQLHRPLPPHPPWHLQMMVGLHFSGDGYLPSLGHLAKLRILMTQLPQDRERWWTLRQRGPLGGAANAVVGPIRGAVVIHRAIDCGRKLCWLQLFVF